MEDKHYYLITPLFQKNLEHLIYLKRIKKYELAKELNISGSNITNYLSGTVKRIGEDVVKNICNFFNVTFAELFDSDLSSPQRNKVKESKLEYKINPDTLDISIFLYFVKQIDLKYTDEKFIEIFKISKSKFFDGIGKKELDISFLTKFIEDDLDLNDLFKYRNFQDVYKNVFDIQ
jgi:transcriptional regulator with XRE-family HTH domain